MFASLLSSGSLDALVSAWRSSVSCSFDEVVGQQRAGLREGRLRVVSLDAFDALPEPLRRARRFAQLSFHTDIRVRDEPPQQNTVHSNAEWSWDATAREKDVWFVVFSKCSLQTLSRLRVTCTWMRRLVDTHVEALLSFNDSFMKYSESSTNKVVVFDEEVVVDGFLFSTRKQSVTQARRVLSESLTAKDCREHGLPKGSVAPLFFFSLSLAVLCDRGVVLYASRKRALEKLQGLSRNLSEKASWANETLRSAYHAHQCLNQAIGESNKLNFQRRRDQVEALQKRAAKWEAVANELEVSVFCLAEAAGVVLDAVSVALDECALRSPNDNVRGMREKALEVSDTKLNVLAQADVREPAPSLSRWLELYRKFCDACADYVKRSEENLKQLKKVVDKSTAMLDIFSAEASTNRSLEELWTLQGNEFKDILLASDTEFRTWESALEKRIKSAVAKSVHYVESYEVHLRPRSLPPTSARLQMVIEKHIGTCRLMLQDYDAAATAVVPDERPVFPKNASHSAYEEDVKIPGTIEFEKASDSSLELDCNLLSDLSIIDQLLEEMDYPVQVEERARAYDNW